MSSLSSILRPRFLLQSAVILTVLVTLYLTFNIDKDVSSQSSQSHSTSTSTLTNLSTKPSTSSSSSSSSSHSKVTGAWKYSRPVEELKPCQKIFLFNFLPWWGFASEFLLFIRSKSLATKLGYVFLPDDSSWNYGRLSNYFLPETIDCIPPLDWNDYRKAYPVGQGKNWKVDSKGKERKRLRYSRAFLSNLDDSTREEYFNTKKIKQELVELKTTDQSHSKERDRWILEPGNSLPRVFEKVFKDLELVTKEVWKLNREMKGQVEGLKESLGLNKPKWLQGGQGQGEKGGRGPIIGYVHSRQKEVSQLQLT